MRITQIDISSLELCNTINKYIVSYSDSLERLEYKHIKNYDIKILKDNKTEVIVLRLEYLYLSTDYYIASYDIYDKLPIAINCDIFIEAIIKKIIKIKKIKRKLK